MAKPTLAQVDSFEHGAASTVAYSSVAGTPTFDTTTFLHGTRSLRLNPSAATENVELPVSAGFRVCSTAFYFRLEDIPAASARVYSFVRSGGTNARINISSAGVVSLEIPSGGAQSGTGPTLSADTWYRFVAEYDTSGATATARVSVFSVTTGQRLGDEISMSIVIAAADQTHWELGTNGAHTFDAYYDSWICSRTDGDYELMCAMRSHEVQAYIPSSDGTHNITTSGDFDSFTGTAFDNSTTNGHTFIGHRPLQSANTADQVIRQELGTTANYMEFNLENISGSPGSPIDARAFGCHVESAASGASLGEARLLLADNTEILTTSATSVINSTQDPGITVTTRRNMMSRPSGGWTSDQVDGLKARVGFADNAPDVNFIDFMIEVAFQVDRLDGVALTVTPSLPTGAVEEAGGGGDTLDGVVLSVTPTLPTGSLRPSLHGVALSVTPSLPVGNIGGSQLLGTVLAVTPSLPTGNLGGTQFLGVVLTVTPSLPTGVVHPSSLVGTVLTVTPSLPTGVVHPSSLVGTVLAVTPTLPTGAVTSPGANLTGVVLAVTPVLPKGEGVWSAENFISFAGSNDSVDFDPDRINIAFNGDFWSTSDTGGGLFRTLSGDTAEVDVLTIGNASNARLFMLRKSTAADAAFYCILNDSDNTHITTVWRTTDGGTAGYAGDNTGMAYNSAKPLRLRLVYSGGTVTGYASQDSGLTWTALPSPQSISGLTLEGLVGGSGGTATGTNVFARGGHLFATSVVAATLLVTPTLPIGSLFEHPALRGVALQVIPTLPLGSIAGPGGPQDLHLHPGQAWVHHDRFP